MARTMFKISPREIARRRELKREDMKKRVMECSLILCEYANMALKHFNELNTESGTESTDYELVREVNCGAFLHGRRGKKRVWYQHVNFLAKPKGAPDSEIKLFFTEIRDCADVMSCSIVGPQGVVTGPRGCKTCEDGNNKPPRPEEAVVQHPLDGKFTKGRYRPTCPMSDWDTSVLDD